MECKLNKSQSSWGLAIDLCKKYIKKPRKADYLLEELVKNHNVEAKRNSQFLFLGVLRHWSLIHNVLEPLYKKQPNIGLKALLMVALFEILEHGEDTPKIIHYAVDFTKTHLSQGESGFVNAILRKAATRLNEIKQLAKTGSVQELALCYSHPEWLIARWVKDFGVDTTRQYLEWNQLPPAIYARARNNVSLPEAIFEPVPEWDGFYRYVGKDWSQVEKLLAKGDVYVQDPSTQVAPGMLSIKRDMSMLDLCAAPGGKSLLLADALSKAGGGMLVSVDLPNERLSLLKENLQKAPEDIATIIIGCDVLALNKAVLPENKAPDLFDVVFLDVPCSNTGVIRRRPDIKERLQPEDFVKLPKLQSALLQKASEFVKPGGQLAYSTCSIDKEENEGVVNAFLAQNKSFTLKSSKTVYPWQENRDGAGAFVLIRNE